MVEQKQRYRAQIGDKEFTIVGNGTVAHMEAVNQLLNEQLAQIQQLAPKLATEDQALLLAFNAMSDQLKKQTELDELKNAEEGA